MPNLSLKVPVLLLAALAALPGTALAQSTDTKTLAVTGNVPAMCVGGTVGGDGAFNLGVLIDTATGLLRTDLSAPARVITGSYCSTRSTINVAATPLAATNFTATPSSGFSRSVNYTATASGWTPTAASFAIGAASNAAATQTRDSAFSGDITVNIGSFGVSGGNALRLVADTAYRGLVTVTLTAVN